jgi:NH3-dependent NAD+ synthetase
MYAVNAGLPKTWVQLLIDFHARNEFSMLKEVLKKILKAPITPELLENQDKRTVLVELKRLRIADQVILLAQHHSNYWIRLLSQRLIGHLFAAQLQLKENLTSVLGLDIPEQQVDFTFKLINCLKKSVQSEELRN